MSEQTPPRLDDPNFEKLTEHIQRLLEQVESLPYPKVQADIFELLNCMDMLHREVLTRLIELIEMQAPQLKLAMANDYAIQMLMMLYNFVPEETGADARPASVNSTFIPRNEIDVAPALQMPIWVPVGAVADLPIDQMVTSTIEDTNVLLCHIDEKIYALHNACLESILPLDRGTLDGHIITCPWHGCQYDVRSGEMQNGSGQQVKTYPVKVEDGRFFVGFNIPEHMRE